MGARGLGWRAWPCNVGGVRDGGYGHAVWEGFGIEGVAIRCGRGLGWRVWLCSVGEVRDGRCGLHDSRNGVTFQVLLLALTSQCDVN